MSSKHKAISRREFLTRTGQTAIGIAAAGALASCTGSQVGSIAASQTTGANDRVNIAMIGIRNRGNALTATFAKIAGVHIKTLCDVDENLYAQRVKEVEQQQGSAPSTQYDLRRVLDDKDIDAVVVATPNHWHALATIWACQAGKHVYVEKPCSHNIFEGRKTIAAARKYNCLVQGGFQFRSTRNIRQAMKFLHDGGIGEVYMARGLCFKSRGDIGKYPDGPMSKGEEFNLTVDGDNKLTYDCDYLKGVHYDLWLGPAPQRPFNRNRFHYNYHWFWDYGNGDIGAQGPHQFDIARWGLNKNEHPVKITSTGGYFAFDSAQETPNTQTAVYEYADGKILQFDVRGLYTNIEEDINVGNFFYGTKGWMHIKGDTWKTFFGRKNEPGPAYETAGEYADPMNLAGTGEGAHCENFIRAIRSGKSEYITCDIETAFFSDTLHHLANISYRLGRQLTFDGAKEKFVGDDQANRMLTRNYRDPYVVTENV